jgi:RNA polymerase sigma-70 factor (ECF subfamily)
MKTHTDIETLFEQITRQDDVKSFEHLFDQFFAPLTCYANRYIDSLEVCEDIVQELFFKIWKKRRELVIKTSVRNFLVTSIKHSCIDHLRRKETESHYFEKQPTTADSQSDNLEELYAAHELEEMFMTALAKIPPHVREVFEMNRFQELTYREIADAKGLSIKTVESYMSKTLKILRVELKDYLPLLLLLIK